VILQNDLSLAFCDDIFVKLIQWCGIGIVSETWIWGWFGKTMRIETLFGRCLVENWDIASEMKRHCFEKFIRSISISVWVWAFRIGPTLNLTHRLIDLDNRSTAIIVCFFRKYMKLQFSCKFHSCVILFFFLIMNLIHEKNDEYNLRTAIKHWTSTSRDYIYRPLNYHSPVCRLFIGWSIDWLIEWKSGEFSVVLDSIFEFSVSYQFHSPNIFHSGIRGHRLTAWQVKVTIKWSSKLR
jgi:hypothetical protein